MRSISRVKKIGTRQKQIADDPDPICVIVPRRNKKNDIAITMYEKSLI